MAEARHDLGVVDEAGALVEVDRGGAFAAGEQVERVDAGQAAGVIDQCRQQGCAGAGAARCGEYAHLGEFVRAGRGRHQRAGADNGVVGRGGEQDDPALVDDRFARVGEDVAVVILEDEHLLDPRGVDGREMGGEGVGVGEDVHRGGGSGLVDMDKGSGIFAGMQTVSYAEASANLEALMDKVVADRLPIGIICKGGERAVLVSESEWASIENTLRLPQPPEKTQEVQERTTQSITAVLAICLDHERPTQQQS